MKRKSIYSTFLIILTLYLSALTQERCKIIGFVKNRSTGVIVAGAEIKIGGTSHGVKSDERGRYSFEGLDPGTYTLTAYRSEFLTDVKRITLEGGDIKAVNFSLLPEELESQITGSFIQNPFIEKVAISSKIIFTSRELRNLPVRGSVPLLELVPGITHIGRGDTYSIRGSRTGETGYFIDGMPVRNFYNGGSSFMLPHSAIEKVEIQRGWFDAKYGRIMGGIVNIVPQHGGEKYGGNITSFTEAVTGLWIGARNYGYKLYEGSVGGPLYKLPKGRFFISFERKGMDDRTPSPTSTIFYPDGRLPGNNEKDFSLFSNASYLLKDNMEFEIGGGIRSNDYNTFNLRYRFDIDHVIHRDNSKSFYYVKYAHQLGDKTYYTLKLSRTGETGVTEDNVHRDDLWDYTRMVYNQYDDMRLYYSQWGDYNGLSAINSWSKFRNSHLTLKGDFTHQLTKSHRLEAGFDYQRHTLRYFEMGSLRNAYKNTMQFTVEDITSYGYDWPREEDGSYVTPAVLQDYFRYGDNDVFHEWDPTDPLMSNVEPKIKKVNSGKKAPKRPSNMSLYLQDKIEYENVLINVGLRFDRFDPDAEIIADYNLPIDPETNKLKLKNGIASHRISPRLGIGFKAGDKANFHANYGQFFQLPTYNMLVIPYDTFEDRASRGSIASRNNPALKPEQLTAYEFGFSQYLYKNVWFDITLFYKNYKDLVYRDRIESIIGYFSQYLNGDVGTARGYEFSLYLKQHRNFNFFINYTLMHAYGTGSNPDSNSRQVWVGDPILDHPERLDFDRRHKITADMDYRFRYGEGPLLFGKKILQESGFNMLFKAGSGMPYQPAAQPRNSISLQADAPVPIGPRNSLEGPWIFSLDFKANKMVRIKDSFKLNFYIWALNITNRINAEQVFLTTGKVDYNGWLETEPGQAWLAIYGSPFRNTSRAHYEYWAEIFKEGGEGAYNDVLRDPMKYFNPRIIRFGLEILF